MMKRWAFLLTLVAGIGLVGPVRASFDIDGGVPSGDVSCEVTHLNDVPYTASDSIGRGDCESATIRFEVTGTASTKYDAYTGTKCTSDDKDKCELIKQGEIGSSGTDKLDLSVSELVTKNEQNCLAAERTITVYIFLDGASTGDKCSSFDVDTAGPVPPSDVDGKPGEHEISITWEEVPGVTDYKVYYRVVDDCEETVEAAEEVGKEYEDALMEFWEKLTSDPDAGVVADAGTFDPDELDSNWVTVNNPDDFESVDAKGGDHKLDPKASPGDELLVRVTALDENENESLFSDPICVRVIRTRGFCDSTDKCEDGCSVGPIGKAHAHTTAGVVVGLLTLLALVWARRRSRS